MKLAFVSNFFNHHQRFVSDEWYALTNGEYTFVQTAAMPEERKKLGYRQELTDYVMTYEEAPTAVQAIIDDCDAVVIGSAPEALLETRKQRRALIFRYAERPLKNGREWHKFLPRWIKWHRQNPSGLPIYLLCSSAYTAADYAAFGLFQNRAYKWGYFTQTKHYDDLEVLFAAKQTNTILWCGRFLDWKHPDDLLTVAKRLKDEGYRFEIDMIGTGELEQDLRRQIDACGLGDTVHMRGSTSPEQVRGYMERAGIYVFTSDRQEGWGAVLNEAMNSGCAVVASHAIGAVPFLMKDQHNGLVYRSGNLEGLYRRLKALLKNPHEQRRLGEAAYHTIIGEWNPETAAQRLKALSECILAGEIHPDLYQSGPCSKAPIVRDDWFSKE